jgi:hypothetical protein
MMGTDLAFRQLQPGEQSLIAAEHERVDDESATFLRRPTANTPGGWRWFMLRVELVRGFTPARIVGQRHQRRRETPPATPRRPARPGHIEPLGDHVMRGDREIEKRSLVRPAMRLKPSTLWAPPVPA